jgi:WD40 repeat protein
MADFEGARLRRCAPDGTPASCVDAVVGPPGAIAVALSPDVRRLAVGYEGAVAVYDLAVAADGTPPKVSESVVEGEVLSVAWSATGDRLAVGTREDRLLVLGYRVEAGRVVAERADETSVRAPLLALAWSPAGPALAFPCEDDAICVRRPGADGSTTVTHRLHGHRNTVSRLAWSPDGTRLASVDDDQEVRIWRMMPDTRVLSVLETDGLHVLRAVAVDRPRGRVAAGDDAGRVWLWHGLDVWQAPRLLPAPPGVSAPAVAIEFAPDGALAVLHEDTGIAIRDPGGGAVERYEAIAGSFNRLAWIDGGRQIAVPLIPRRILLVPRAGAARVLPDPGIALDARSVAPLPGGDGFVANYTDGSIWPWSNDGTLGADALVTAADAGAGARGGMSLTFDATGQRLSVSRDDDLVRVYDLSGASRPLDLLLPAPISVGVAFGPRGPDLAVLGGDAQLHLWTVDEEGATARFSVAAPAHVGRLAQRRGVSSRPVTALAWWDETHLLLASAAGNLLVLDLDEAHWRERAASLGLASPAR